ncbi:hypothetical protein CsSME_00025604 [Camellia sinensis var. sinensis]
MENGVGIVDGSRLEDKIVEHEVLDSRVEERGVVGSDESKDVEVDEVFEEAIGVDTPRVYSVVNRDDVVEEVGDLGGSVEIEDNSDVGSDLEKFEEAIGVPVEVGNYEEELPVGVEDKVEEGLVGGEPTDEAAVQEVIDEESVDEKVVSDEMNQMENDVMVSAGEHADIAAAGENGHQVDQKSDVVGEKFENDVSDIVSLEATPVREISGNGHANKEAMLIEKELETGDAKIVQGGDPDFQQEVGSTGEILHQVGKSEEVKETLGLLDTGHQDYKSWENEDAVASEIQIDKVEEVRDSLVNLDVEPKDDQSMELKVEVSASPVLLHHSDKNEELEDTANELNGTSATTDSDHHGISLKPEDKLHTFVEGREVTPEVDKFPISEDSVVVTDENVQASASNLGAKKIEGYKLQHADKVVEASNAVAKVPENKGIENVKSSPQQMFPWPLENLQILPLHLLVLPALVMLPHYWNLLLEFHSSLG